MVNKIFTDGYATRRFYACPSTVVSGDPVLIDGAGGAYPAVAFESYDATRGGAVFDLDGTFALTVIAATVVSPLTGSAIKEGQLIYATGTTDATTGMTTGLTLSKASGGMKFGTYDSPTGINSGVTSTTARVKLRGTAQ